MFVDLALTALSSCLDDGFAQGRHAPHVKRRELPAARIGRQRTARTELPVLDEGSALALLAEAVVFQRHEHGVGVAVVQLANIDVLGADAGHAEHRLRGQARARLRLRRVARASRVARMALAHAPHPHRRLRHLLRLVGRTDDHGHGPIRDEAAVQQVQRCHDPAGSVVLLEREGILHLRVRVHGRPGALGDGDRAELVLGRAVERHVAPGGQGVGSVRAEVASSRREPEDATRSRAPSRVAVGRRRGATLLEGCVREHADDVFGHARVDRHRRVLHHLRRRRSGRVHVVQQAQIPHAEHVLQLQADAPAGESGDARVNQETIDVGLVEAGIGDGEADGIDREIGRALPVDAPHGRNAEARNGRGSAKSMCHGRDSSAGVCGVPPGAARSGTSRSPSPRRSVAGPSPRPASHGSGPASRTRTAPRGLRECRRRGSCGRVWGCSAKRTPR